MSFVEFVKELTPESTSALLNGFLISIGVHQIDWNYILTPSDTRGEMIATRLMAPKLEIEQSERLQISRWYVNQQANTFGNAVLRYLQFMEDFALNTEYDMSELEYAEFIEKQLAVEEMLVSLPTRAKTLEELKSYLTKITRGVDDMIFFYEGLSAKKSPAFINFYRNFHHNFTTRVYIWSLVGNTLGVLLMTTEGIAKRFGRSIASEYSNFKFDPTNSSVSRVLRQIHATRKSPYMKQIEYVVSDNYRKFSEKGDLKYYARVPKFESENIVARAIDHFFGTATTAGVGGRTIFLYGVSWATYFGRGYLPSDNVVRMLMYLLVFSLVQYVSTVRRNKSKRDLTRIFEAIDDMDDRKEETSVQLQIVRSAIDIIRKHGGEILDNDAVRDLHKTIVQNLVNEVCALLEESCDNLVVVHDILLQIRSEYTSLLKLEENKAAKIQKMRAAAATFREMGSGDLTKEELRDLHNTIIQDLVERSCALLYESCDNLVEVRGNLQQIRAEYVELLKLEDLDKVSDQFRRAKREAEMRPPKEPLQILL
jgi:hypothetical protein